MTFSEMRTPLYDLHLELGAKMVPFAGYSMPVQYPAGVLKEHLHTRASAGLFDVSHMGQVLLRPRSGNLADAALALERLVPVDILALQPCRQRYAVFTNHDGGILDDLMVANLGEALLVVVNAACKQADMLHLKTHLHDAVELEELDGHALLALQGPKSEGVLTRLGAAVGDMKFMDVRRAEIAGIAVTLSRSGYSGEDGFEISVPAGDADRLARKILQDAAVLPIGLGARDSLRLEAGLCLYGHDLDPSITPVEAALEWAIQKSRRSGGTRAGGYPGAAIIDHQLQHGAARRRVGLLAEGRAPVREHTQLFALEDAASSIGEVTSGGFGPSVNAPVAMGYVPGGMDESGTLVFAELRGKRLPMRVAAMPFVAAGYRRG